MRISGPTALAIARDLTRIEPRPRVAELCAFRDASGSVIDHGLLLSFPAPHSYTGEDVVELQCHGGRVVTERQTTDVVTLTEVERDAVWTASAAHAWRGVTAPPADLFAAIEDIVVERLSVARTTTAARALRGQAAFFRAVDMDDAADHCEQSAIGWESQAVTDALARRNPPEQGGGQ